MAMVIILCASVLQNFRRDLIRALHFTTVQLTQLLLDCIRSYSDIRYDISLRRGCHVQGRKVSVVFTSKTLEKKFLRVLAVSSSDTAIRPSFIRSGLIPVFDFTFDRAYFKKAFGFDFQL